MSIRILSVIISAIFPLTYTDCLQADLHNIWNPQTPVGMVLSILNMPSNAMPGFTITPVGIPGMAGECGVASTYDLVLDSPPAADVRVQVNFDPLHLMVNGVVVSPYELLFTPQNWNQPQQLVVSSPDDSIPDEGTVVSVMDIMVLSDDPDYAALTPESISLTVLDNDDFRINTYTTNDQDNPASASNSNSTVVVWVSNGQDGSYEGVYGRRFTATGEAACRGL